MSLSPKLRHLVGKSTPARWVEIEKGQIRRFAAAIGEDNPIHFDEEAAKKVGFRSLVAPPTFACGLTPGDVFLDDFGWDVQAMMHRAEEYEYVRPICAGDRLHLVHQIADVYEQQAAGGSTLIFIVIETRGRDARERQVFKSRRVLVKLQS